MDIEAILNKIPLKIMLGHYWEVFDLIAWRLKSQQIEGNECFTLEEVTDYLLNEFQEISNPIVKRLYFRALMRCRVLLNKLVSLGLLIKKDNVFCKADVYFRVYRLLKFGLRNNSRRLVALAICNLYNNGITSFSTRDLLTELSYSDAEYKAELPYLYVRNNETWLRLLEWQNGSWVLVAKPYRPNKPILLLDIMGRLLLAVFELAKDKSKFSEDEILTKLREMETRSLERILRALGLRSENNIWIIDKKILDNLGKLLLEVKLALTWPFYGSLHVKSPYFKLLGSQSRSLYVDVPNSMILDFLFKLERICEQFKADPTKMFKHAKSLAEEYNEKFKQELGSWLKLSVRKAAFLSKPFGVKVCLKWSEFYSFLENFSKKDIPLHKKYEYILFCRAPSLSLVIRRNTVEIQAAVKDAVKDEITSINEILNEFIDFLENIKYRLYKIVQRRKTVLQEPSLLLYLPEMIAILRSLASLIENGAIPTCYREMRKVLENLAWVVLMISYF